MTKYLDSKPFSVVAPVGSQWRENHDAIFMCREIWCDHDGSQIKCEHKRDHEGSHKCGNYEWEGTRNVGG